MTGALDDDDLLAAALIFGGFRSTFRVGEFTEFLQTQAHGLSEEEVDERLAAFAERGALRQVGPGVYAKPPIEQPLWPEEGKE